MNKKIVFHERLLGNFLLAFLSPLAGSGSTLIIIPDDWGMNVKILISALISACIVTGFVIGRELEKAHE